MSIVRGERIAAKRVELKLSQADLAHIIGTSQTRLSTYESGSRQPTLRVLIRISNALNEPIDNLVDRDKTLQLSDLDPDDLEFLNEWRTQRRALMISLINKRLAKVKRPLRNAVDRLITLLESQSKVKDFEDEA